MLFILLIFKIYSFFKFSISIIFAIKIYKNSFGKYYSNNIYLIDNNFEAFYFYINILLIS